MEIKVKKSQIISLLLALAVIFSFGIVYAQGEEITLKFSRDFGFASGTGKIQGLFSMKVASSEQLTEVVFYIDGESIGKDVNEPFNLQFNTDIYTPGVHTLYAIGHTIDGRELKTREEITEFISAQDSKKAMLTLIVPILGLSLIAVLLSAIIPVILSKKKGALAPGTERNYSVAGGTICSRCNRPFSRHMFAPNMLFGKLERCPHCGKWGIFRAYPMDVLRKAEESELDTGNLKIASKTSIDENDKLRDELDDTKYQGM
jgi:hypothetical protein